MSFNFVVCTYILAMVSDALLIFFSIFHIIIFDELKTECKNPIDQCDSLNPLVLPEYIIHLFFNILFLIGGEWISFAISVPLMVYHIIRHCNRPVMSGFDLYDATSIMNADKLDSHQREGWFKLAFYVFAFFYYLVGMIRALITV